MCSRPTTAYGRYRDLRSVAGPDGQVPPVHASLGAQETQAMMEMKAKWIR